MMQRFRTPALLAATLMLLACGSDKEPLAPGKPTMQEVAGSYRAEGSYGTLKFATTSNGQTIDWLAAGAKFNVVLASNGTTTGHLFIPGGDEDGGDFDADLAGSWTLKGDTIRFAQTADTFVRDMPFLVRGTTLEGDRSFSGTRVQVSLVKQ